MPETLSLPTFNPHDKSLESLKKAAGQLLVVGFYGAASEPPSFISEALAAGEIGGTILFRRNIESVEQVLDLTEAIHAAAQGAIELPWVAVDQEGGRVVRLQAPLTRIPPMGYIGRLKNPRDVASVAEVIASEVATLGFNLNFAPVLDVNTNPNNPVIGDRSFSDDPHIVAQMGGAFLFGHLMAGVVPCGKHFPGHGDTHQDSHLELPVIEHDIERLRKIELIPFQKAAQSNFPMLMTAHIKVPALDTVHPATLSHAIISNLLREKLNYGGIVVSDCLEMKAVADHYEIEEMVQLGLRAGIEMFLICHTEEKWRRAHEHLVKLAFSNDLDRFCLIHAANKVTKLKQNMFGTLPRPWKRETQWQNSIGTEDNYRIIEKIAEKLNLPIDVWQWRNKSAIKNNGQFDPTEQD